MKRLFAIAVVPLLLGQLAPPQEGLVTAALEAGRWIDAHAVATEAGTVWPMDPARSSDVSLDLYSGTAGVVLFFVDLHRATGQERWLERAVSGAREIAASVESPADDVSDGLYTGLAGRCVTLDRVASVAGNDDLGRAVAHCLRLLIERAEPVGAGVEWNGVTDVIGGSSGIGLTLLRAHERHATPGALETAIAAGDQLLEQARPADGGFKWAMSEDFPRLMPNFSHGTAGIAYYLARLYEASGLERFREAALAGGRYLQEVATTEGQVCLVFHHEPEGEELYYLSWCHGPAGTGRTFYQLHRITGDEEWLEWTRRAAAGILESGIPEVRTPGFWNNVGRCCGNAGVVEFMLDLYQEIGDPAYLRFARRMTEDLLDRATRDGDGLRWVQAEHRVQPDNLAAQTGYMQGAAGIGSMLLRLRAVESGGPAPVVLPDSPFGG